MREIVSPLDGIRSPFGFIRGGGVVPFSPSTLFASGEEGAWYEPSTTTAFRSTTDLTPCGYGQSAGFLLDLSKGAGYSGGSFAGLGSELVTNGTFDTDVSGWTLDELSGTNNHTFTYDAGRGRITSVSGGTFPVIKQSFTTVVGKTYVVYFDVVDTNNPGYVLRVGTTDEGFNLLNASTTTDFGVSFSVEKSFVATTTTTHITIGMNNSANTEFMLLDNISVRELPGNHATQGSEPARPILARVPETGRRNLATTTELDNTLLWTREGLSSLTGGQTDPSGGTDAFLLTENTNSSAHRIYFFRQYASGAVTVQVKAKAVNRRYINFNLTSFSSASFIVFDLQTASVSAQNGGEVVSSNASDLGDGWVLCTATVNVTNTTAGRSLVIGGNDGAAFDDAYVGSGTDAFYLSGFQLEAASSASDYQKVVDQYDITEAGVTSLEYLAFDGSDDELIHNGVLLNAATAVSQFNATQRQEISGSNTLYRMALHDGSLSGGNNYVLDRHNAGGNHGFFVSDGSSSAVASVGTSTNLVTYLTGQIVSSGSQTYRVNGAVEGSGTVSLSSVTTDVLVIGGSGLSSAFWEGKYFGGLVVDRLLTAQEISDTETYLAAKSGVTL